MPVVLSSWNPDRLEVVEASGRRRTVTTVDDGEREDLARAGRLRDPRRRLAALGIRPHRRQTRHDYAGD